MQLDAQPQMGGYYVFRTHGWASTNNIQTALEDIHREFGTLYRAPVRLFMQKTEDVYTDGSQERTGWSWKVGLTLRLSPVEAREYLAAQAREALQTREQLRVEAGQVVGYLNSADVESETEIADEFHPPKGLLASVATADRLEGAVQALNGLDAPEAVQEAVEVPVEEPAEEEVQEAEEPAPEEVQTGAIPPKVEMENLLKYAEEIGLEFSDEQLQRCQEGLAGTKKLQEQVINWVKDRIHKHKEKA